MNELRPVVLVTRACSDIGQRVVDMLRRHGGFAVRRMVSASGSVGERTRSDRSQAVDIDSIELVCGDCDDFEILRQAMAGCYGVIGVFGHASDQGTAALRSAAVMALIDASADAGVGRVALVFDGREAGAGSGAVRSIEQYAESAGVALVPVLDAAMASDAVFDSLAVALSRGSPPS